MKSNLLNLSQEEFAMLGSSLGARPFVGAQLFQWIYQKGETDFQRMTNIPLSVRAMLADKYRVDVPNAIEVREDKDGTRKFLFELGGGGCIESVLIPMGAVKRTLCISTQVGCAMGCGFCRTGTMGLVRNLTQGEILAQALAVKRLPATSDRRPTTVFTNIVLMGMGEPLHNYDAVVGALRIITDPEGIGIGKRRVTLSTVGLVPGIRKLAGEALGIKLALSLHATTDEQRAALIPAARRYPLREILSACHEYYVACGKRNRITLEYLMLRGFNDTKADAERLVGIVSHLPSKVNLIPLNPFSGCAYERPDDVQIEDFASLLRKKHVQVNIRASRGREILAACGQLATISKGGLSGGGSCTP